MSANSYYIACAGGESKRRGGRGQGRHRIAAPVQRAARLGIPTVEINPGESEVSSLVDVRLPLGAADALTRIWDAYGEQHPRQGLPRGE